VDAEAAAPRHADWRYELSRRIALTDAAVLIAMTSAAVLKRFGFNSRVTANGPLEITRQRGAHPAEWRKTHA
jgi:hypothetical protein